MERRDEEARRATVAKLLNMTSSSSSSSSTSSSSSSTAVHARGRGAVAAANAAPRPPPIKQYVSHVVRFVGSAQASSTGANVHESRGARLVVEIVPGVACEPDDAADANGNLLGPAVCSRLDVPAAIAHDLLAPYRAASLTASSSSSTSLHRTCAACHVAPRRYVDARTGLPACSLTCVRVLHSHASAADASTMAVDSSRSQSVDVSVSTSAQAKIDALRRSIAACAAFETPWR